MDLTLEVLNAKMKRETLVGNRTTVIIFFNHGNAAFFYHFVLDSSVQ